MKRFNLRSAITLGAILLLLAQFGVQQVEAKPKSNFNWSNLQVASVSFDRKSINVTRYSKSLNVLGSKMLVKAGPGVYLEAFDYDYTYGNKRRWFVFGAYRLHPDKQRIYIVDLANPKSTPKTLVSLGENWATSVQIDPASGNVLWLRSTAGSGQVIENISRTGKNRKQIWYSESSNLPYFYAWSIYADTGSELFIFGDNGGQNTSSEIQISAKGDQEETLIRNANGKVSGGGRIRIGLFDALDVIATTNGGWACTTPATNTDVSSDYNCRRFRPVSDTYKSVSFDSGSGYFKGMAQGDTTIIWKGNGANYLQGVHLDPTNLPEFSPIVQIKNGEAAHGGDLVITSDMDVALDELAHHVIKIRKW